MGAKTGRQYIEALRDGRHLYVNGERVSDVTQYPPFQRVIAELAALYDRQHEPATRELLTFTSPTSGEPVSLSFLILKSFDNLLRRVTGERARISKSTT
jgi:4-hydroxyphenylacetate 3-monooxygenase